MSISPFSYLLSLGQISTPTHPYRRGDFLKIEWYIPPWVRWQASTENEVVWINSFWDILLTDTHTDRQTRSNKSTNKLKQDTKTGKLGVTYETCCDGGSHFNQYLNTPNTYVINAGRRYMASIGFAALAPCFICPELNNINAIPVRSWKHGTIRMSANFTKLPNF